MELSILIPTHRRPDLLDSALRSIAAQVRRDLIREVLVSENSEATESRQVCARFPELPVRHMNRQPALGPMDHFRILATEARSPWVAWIADDDMWSRYHLAEAERLLKLRPEAVAFAASCVRVANESWQDPSSYGPSLRYGEPAPVPFADHDVWDLVEILTESLLRTPLNLWGVVARREPFVSAVTAWHGSRDSWCNDRIFWCSLARFGPVVTGREVSLYVRQHPQAASSQYAARKTAWDAGSAGITRDILQMAAESGIDLRKEWDQRWRRLSPKSRLNYLVSCLPGAVAELRRQWGPEQLNSHSRSALVWRLSEIGRVCCPPLLWETLSRIRRRWRRPTA